MSTVNSENSKSSLDGLKWTITVLLLAAVIVGNYLYGEETHVVLRVAVLLVLAALAVLSAAFTEKGKTFIGFAKDARLEVRKVVWPTRQETVQTTLIILAVSTIVGLVLWGLDGIFVRVVSFITTSI
ncbi:preprotein translocase subunit SecE [Psychromonas sp. 14N.309.X.WAT.B.A12]|jgi:preprotein translocase subunit SecE|uniref:preprotein translocase subunit SecE n=1 Tax=unclassified Psychromonas TaxID=2614957 RepID=UPI0025AEF78C|nr:preprotein translocase subunit SecE [Psychromonas sp. 14N.309.X.WAT.B.A12]MDN2664420.1 preprotein translocase subunit SecE [Psychromonas sp. 14N.309.X.WAT.B.A12]